MSRPSTSINMGLHKLPEIRLIKRDISTKYEYTQARQARARRLLGSCEGRASSSTV